MTSPLYPPGVEVITSVTTNSATIATPTLVPCLIGPCYQLMDVTDDDGVINSEALAGNYSGNAKVFDYPNLVDYAEVKTTSVDVYFRYGNSSTLTRLDADEYYATTTSFIVSGGAQGIDPGDSIKVDVYVTYEALRLDLAGNSDYNIHGTRTGTTIETVSDITTYLGEIDVRNPLALAAYLAKQNAPNTSVLCVGIDDISSQAPYGTAEAYARALEFCELLEVYSIVVLSQGVDVMSQLPAHVNAMSAQHAKKERIGFICPEMPDTAADETQASGSYGSVISNNTFETSGDLTDVSEDDILLVTGDTTEYVIQTIVGSRVTVLPATLSGSGDTAWSIYTPGAALTNRNDVAQAYATIAESYNNRRIFLIVPDVVEVTVDGLTQEVPGFYAAACVAGQVGEVKPSQPLSNFPIAGLVGLDGSNDYFTDTQLNIIAGGGCYILVQLGDGTLPKCRHQLSTYVSTIEYRELSITKALDYTAKILRATLQPLVGVNIITDKFINLRVSPALGSIVDYLKTYEVIGQLTNIRSIKQSESEPDTLEVVIDVAVNYPCNTIRITLEI